MKRSNLSVVLLVLVLLLASVLVVACGGEEPATTTAGGATDTTQPASGEVIELSLASLYPAGSPPAQSLDRWCEKIAEDSGGRLKVRHYTDNTLVAAPDMRTGVEAGTADLGCSFIYKPEPGFDPSLVMSQLILGLNYEDCLKIFDDMWSEFPELWNGQWDKFKVMWVTVIDPNLLFTTKKPVRTMDDIKGLQIRMPSKSAGEMLKSLGAAPVEMSTADWVVSLDKGTTDGAVTSAGSVLDHKIGEKLKYVTLYSTGPGVTFLIMNKQKYDSLPADLQKILDDNMDFGKQDMIQSKKDAEKAAFEYLETTGTEVITLAAEEYEKWNVAVRPVFDKIAADLDAKGFPGTELINFCLERAEYYQAN